MTVLVFAGASVVAPAPVLVSPWTAMRHTWTGWNGDAFDLSNGLSGVALLEGVRGLGVPDFTDFWTEGPGKDGADWVDAIASKREVFWPLEVWQDGSSAEWLEHDRRLFRTFDRRRPGIWSVTNPATNETRSLRLRFRDDGQFAAETVPGLFGTTTYGLYFTAEQPFWEGETISKSWGQPEAPVNLLGGGPITQDGLAPPFVFGSGVSINTAQIDNPGDEKGYPVWTVYGPTTNVTVGLGGEIIEIPTDLLASQWVQIDTRTQSTIWGAGWMDDNGNPVDYGTDGARADPSTGVNRIPDGLGLVTGFATVAPGEFLALAITMTGEGRVAMDLKPLYERDH